MRLAPCSPVPPNTCARPATLAAPGHTSDIWPTYPTHLPCTRPPACCTGACTGAAGAAQYCHRHGVLQQDQGAAGQPGRLRQPAGVGLKCDRRSCRGCANAENALVKCVLRHILSTCLVYTVLRASTSNPAFLLRVYVPFPPLCFMKQSPPTHPTYIPTYYTYLPNVVRQ